MYPSRKKNSRVDIYYLRDVADSRGGKLLQVKGDGNINQKARMQWRC